MSLQGAARNIVHGRENNRLWSCISRTGCDTSLFLCRDPNTIFRGNSLTSKCIDETMKLAGRHYLQVTLKPVIDEVTRTVSEAASVNRWQKVHDTLVCALEHSSHPHSLPLIYTQSLMHTLVRTQLFLLIYTLVFLNITHISAHCLSHTFTHAFLYTHTLSHTCPLSTAQHRGSNWEKKCPELENYILKHPTQ